MAALIGAAVRARYSEGQMSDGEVELPLTVWANHFRPWTNPLLRAVFFLTPQEGVGGKLTVGFDELVFEPHAFNSQAEVLRWPTATIAAIEPASALGIIPNQVVIQFRDGSRERFVVARRALVLRALAGIVQRLEQLRAIVEHFRPSDVPAQQRAAELDERHRSSIVGSWTTDYVGWSPASESLVVREDGTGEVAGLQNKTFQWERAGDRAMRVWNVVDLGGEDSSVDVAGATVTWRFEVRRMHDGEEVVVMVMSPLGILVLDNLIC
jgi:hypothetical protein